MTTITEKVAQQLSNSGQLISARVVDVLVEKEVVRLTEATVKAISMMDTLEKDKKKLKPDLISYDDNGTIVSQNWSKQKHDERNSLNSKIAKLQSALDKALDANDFTELLKLTNGSKNDQSAADQE